MMLTYINNKSSSSYTTMLTEDYEGSSIYCTKCYTTQIYINHLTSKVLIISKIKR
jgi:hypothetical protein